MSGEFCTLCLTRGHIDHAPTPNTPYLRQNAWALEHADVIKRAQMAAFSTATTCVPYIANTSTAFVPVVWSKFVTDQLTASFATGGMVASEVRESPGLSHERFWRRRYGQGVTRGHRWGPVGRFPGYARRP